ncbi:hypothetical protein KJ966_17140 [bacterium]|nr:hypothetical protein [bacterium]
MKRFRIVLSIVCSLATLTLSGCNYNYHRGLELEKLGRYEEANIEYKRAHTSSPGDDNYKEAYLRTTVKTTEDLLERYDIYVGEKKYPMAFQRLEKANTLTPDHPRVQEEMKKWYRVLLAGKLELTEIKSLANQIPLTDQIVLEIRFNTPNITRQLAATIDYQTMIFSVEDILYDPPQNLLMLYSVNSVGVKLVNNTTRRSQFKRFVDFKVPVLVDVQGEMKSNGQELTPVQDFYPMDRLDFHLDNQFWFPTRGIRYSLKLDGDVIRVNSSINHIDFLPQIIYFNKTDKRYFLDFGHLQLAQKKIGGMWSFRRKVTPGREYLADLRKNLILNPYFYFREGGYPFILGD